MFSGTHVRERNPGRTERKQIRTRVHTPQRSGPPSEHYGAEATAEEEEEETSEEKRTGEAREEKRAEKTTYIPHLKAETAH